MTGLPGIGVETHTWAAAAARRTPDGDKLGGPQAGVHEASTRDEKREGAQAAKDRYSGVSQLLQTKNLRLDSAYRKSESAILCA